VQKRENEEKIKKRG